jgi:uncharacterized protein (TIRG00374 family)
MIEQATKRSMPIRPWRLGLSWLFGILVLAAVLLVATRFTELQRFAEISRSARPSWLLVAFGLQAMTYVCAAGVWHGALERADVRQSFWSIVPLGLAKLFTDQALPTGGVSGALLVVSGLERRGIPTSIALAALLIGMVSFYVAYLIAVAIGIAILFSNHTLAPLMAAAAGVFVVVAFSIPVFVLALRRWSQQRSGAGLLSATSRWLGRVPGISALKAALAETPTALLRDPVPFASATVLQFLIFALDAGTLWVMIIAIGAEGSPSAAIAAFMMASLAATIGPLPLGLGTFEAVCVAVLHIQGISLEAALTATLLLRGFTFWLPMIPGLVLARRELKGPNRTDQDTVGAASGSAGSAHEHGQAQGTSTHDRN